MDLAIAAGGTPVHADVSGLTDVGLSTALEATAIDATVANSTASFELFYRTNRSTVARALALTLRNTELASDAADEAMARAFERWDNVSTLENPVGWVYRVGLNWSRSLLRRATRPTPVWLTGDGTSTDAAATDPAVDRALGELSVDQRAVVVCRLLLGYSEAQTARALNIRPGTVKSRLSRATTRLQGLLAHLDQS